MPNFRLTQFGPAGGISVTADNQYEARCIIASHVLQPYGDAEGGYVGRLKLEEEDVPEPERDTGKGEDPARSAGVQT